VDNEEGCQEMKENLAHKSLRRAKSQRKVHKKWFLECEEGRI
jgi:hypothetical protein